MVFRANRSTELAALELMDRIINNMNKNLTPINIYVDLSKAFDCLNHDILLSKLRFYGLSDDALSLLKNYLIGYEPAGLTVHPPPPRMIEGGFIFFVWVSSVTKIFSSKKKWIL